LNWSRYAYSGSWLVGWIFALVAFALFPKVQELIRNLLIGRGSGVAAEGDERSSRSPLDGPRRSQCAQPSTTY
jgi:hypothetical protein